MKAPLPDAVLRGLAAGLIILAAAAPRISAAEEFDELVIEDDIVIEEGEPAMEPEPTADPAAEPTPEPAAEPAAEPAPEPTPEPPPEAEPAPEVEPAPATEPAAETAPEAAPVEKADESAAAEDDELIDILEEEMVKPAVKPKAKPPKITVDPASPAKKPAAAPAPKRPSAKKMAPWSSRKQARAFADYLRAGVAAGEDGMKSLPRIVRPALEEWAVATPGRDVVIEGVHPEGQMLAVYRALPGMCFAEYVGLVHVKAKMGETASIARVAKSNDVIEAGDRLYPLDLLRGEFEEQIGAAASAESGRAVEGTIRCLPGGREMIDAADDILLVDRGRSSGVAVGWGFELIVPGGSGTTSYGRVVRVDAATCFVRLLKTHDIISVGNRARLSSDL